MKKQPWSGEKGQVIFLDEREGKRGTIAEQHNRGKFDREKAHAKRAILGE